MYSTERFDTLLHAIPGGMPSGRDLSDSSLFAEMEGARRSEDPGAEWISGTRDHKKADWAKLEILATEALEQHTKDIRVAVFLLEALIHLRGFIGLREGVTLIREFLLRFWDVGLHPQPEDGELEARAAPLAWLGDKLASLIKALPLTLRSSGGNVSLWKYQRMTGDTRAEFDDAVSNTSPAEYEVFKTSFDLAYSEFDKLRKVIGECFQQDAPSLLDSVETLNQCRDLVEQIWASMNCGTDRAVIMPNSDVPSAVSVTAVGSGDASPCGGPLLAHSNNGRDVHDHSGRVRFLNKLRLAGACLDDGRHKLARIILEELATQLDETLVAWEGSETAGLLWQQLYRCYKRAGDDSKAEEFYLKICRLDPWQASACELGGTRGSLSA